LLLSFYIFNKYFFRYFQTKNTAFWEFNPFLVEREELNAYPKSTLQKNPSAEFINKIVSFWDLEIWLKT
jgi:hypothetical protein